MRPPSYKLLYIILINRENQNLRNFPRDAKHPRVNNMQRHSIVKQEKVTSETEQFPIAWINFVRFWVFQGRTNTSK